MKIRRVESYSWKAVAGEVFILDSKQEKTHTLNESAAWIWKLIEDEISLTELATLFINEYDVELQVAQADIKDIVEQLQSNGLVELS